MLGSEDMHFANGMPSQLERGVFLIEHGIHIAVFSILLIFLSIALISVVRFFLQPVASRVLRTAIYGQARELFGNRGRTRNVKTMELTETRERETFIVVPDISGYTRSVHLNRFSAGHAQYVVSELIKSLIDAASPVLKPIHIEGDAVLFQAVPNTTTRNQE